METTRLGRAPGDVGRCGGRAPCSSAAAEGRTGLDPSQAQGHGCSARGAGNRRCTSLAEPGARPSRVSLQVS